MLCKILIINMLDYKFKRFIFNKTLTYLRDTLEYPLKIPFNIGVKYTTVCFLFLSL